MTEYESALWMKSVIQPITELYEEDDKTLINSHLSKISIPGKHKLMQSESKRNVNQYYNTT